MPELRALIIDSDEQFRSLVVEALGASFERVETVSPQDFQLAELARVQPDLVFVAVDLPERLGFRHFNDIKRTDRHARIALCTATLASAELSLHSKLRTHADLYVDKRTATPAELGRSVAALGLTGRARSALDEGASAAPGKREMWITDLLEDGADPETVVALESLGLGTDGALQELLTMPEANAPAAEERPGSLAPGPGPAAEDPDDELTLTRVALQETQLELERAREVARSSPFARGYLDLQERAQRSGQENAELRRRLGVALDASTALRRALARVAKELAAERQFRRTDAEQRAEMHARLAAQASEAQAAVAKIAAVERAMGDHRLQAADATRDRDAAFSQISELRATLEKERGAHHSTREAVERELEALRASHAQELERLGAEKRAELERHEKVLREQAKAELEASEDSWRIDLARREAELGARVSMWEKQVQADGEKLARAERLLQEERAAATLARQERDATRQQIRSLSAAQERALESLRGEHAAELERRSSEHRAALERHDKELRAELTERLELETAHLAEQQAQREGEFDARAAAQEAEVAALRAENDAAAARMRSETAEAVQSAVSELSMLHTRRVDELVAERDELAAQAERNADELEIARADLRERDAELANLRSQLEERESAVASLKLMLDDVYRRDQTDGQE